MTTLLPPQASGVYQIRCIPTGKIYVGSAVNLQKRWQEHRRALRRGKHANYRLQRAWDEFGEEHFEFAVLELVSIANLLCAEQEWIVSTGCVDKDIGFNISDVAGSPGDTRSQVYEGFIAPNGHEVTIVNLEEFCRCNRLSASIMRNLVIGRRNRSHKGWTHKNSVRQRDYVKTYEGFIDPAGNLVEPITNLAEFCRQHGLDNTHMVAVACRRICSHRGWTHIRGCAPRNYKTYTGFINPSGERVTITNLADFCRKNGLHPVKMRQVISGQIRRYKGWTWKEDEQHDE
jgi:group I intron endonuclease